MFGKVNLVIVLGMNKVMVLLLAVFNVLRINIPLQQTASISALAFLYL